MIRSRASSSSHHRQGFASGGLVLRGLPLLVSGGTLIVAMVQQTAPSTPFVLRVPRGIPAPRIPADNPLTVEGVALGKRLFSEVRLSGNNTQACISCHKTGSAFSDQGNAVSRGIDGKVGTRNAMPLFNLAYQPRFFWDGRVGTLRAQALQPIQNEIEMHETLPNVVKKLSLDATYARQFQAAFGTRVVTAGRIGLALEQYMITMLSGDTKFDRFQDRLVQLTALEQRGLQVFRTPFDPRRGQFGGDCARCHGGPHFSNFAFRNNGLDRDPVDLGRAAITGDPADIGKFKTPSLRNLQGTGPYMHDGRFGSLEEVVRHYSDGIQRSPTLDPVMQRQNGGVHLSPQDQVALVAFLKTLTDPKMVTLGGS